MAVTAGQNFANWLNVKLRELNTDENVFGAYIIGILEGDETFEEKREVLQGILSGITDKDFDEIINEIIEKWKSCQPSPIPVEKQNKDLEDVDTKLAKLLENKCIPTIALKQYTPEELRIREQILAQYSQVELDEFDDDDIIKNTGTNTSASSGGSGGVGGGAGAGASSGSTSGGSSIGGASGLNAICGTTSVGGSIEKNDPLLCKNTNAYDVAQAARERREQAKLESKAKKDKDKEDREKQKQLREEKKEKRKTVKGERRR